MHLFANAVHHAFCSCNWAPGRKNHDFSCSEVHKLMLLGCPRKSMTSNEITNTHTQNKQVDAKFGINQTHVFDRWPVQLFGPSEPAQWNIWSDTKEFYCLSQCRLQILLRLTTSKFNSYMQILSFNNKSCTVFYISRVRAVVFLICLECIDILKDITYILQY